MQENRKHLSSDDVGILLLIAAVLFGGWFRIYPALVVDFPIGDGGMFYKIIEALMENGRRLPAYVQYNGLDIPFAYPPLAFYLAAYIGEMFQVSILDLLIWMPAITLVFILPCIYYLALIMLRSPLQAGMTTFLFAFMPRVITWLIMGGGVSRSLGQLFMVLAISQIYLLFLTRKPRYIFSSIVFSAAVCLTHPEAALHTAGAALLIWFFLGRNRETARDAVLVGIGTILFASPWWISVLVRFGVDPFVAAGQTGLHSPLIMLQLFFSFSEEPFLTTITIFSIVGFFIQVAKREYFLPCWTLFHFLLEPRSAANVSIVPMAMLASICVTELILPGIAKAAHESRAKGSSVIFRSVAEKIFMGYLTISTMFGMLYFEWQHMKNVISEDMWRMMAWVKHHTQKESEFLIITGRPSLFGDYVNEWFPVLAERRSNTTIQGYEWTSAEDFAKMVEALRKIQLCDENLPALVCIEDAAQQAQIRYSHVLVVRSTTLGGNLMYELELSERYSRIHETNTMVLYALDVP